MLTDKDVPNHDKGFSEDIKKYFSSSIADAEKLVASAEPKGGKDEENLADTSSDDETKR